MTRATAPGLVTSHPLVERDMFGLPPPPPCLDLMTGWEEGKASAGYEIPPGS